MRWSYVQTAKPATTPVSVNEVLEVLRVEGTDDRGTIEGLIQAATEFVEKKLWTQLVTATWEMRGCSFGCGPIALHPNPVSEIDSIEYINTAGQTVTLTENTDYVVDTGAQPALVRPAYGVSWPSTRGYANDVTITLIAGYGAAFDVPPTIKEAIKLIVNHWYQGCGDAASIPLSADCLLSARNYAGFA